MYKSLTQKLWQPPCAIAKLLLIMKLTTLILITAILQVSAASYGQRVNLSVKNKPLATVLEQIRTQTGYDFLFKTETLKDAKMVSIHVINAELKDVLTRLLEPQHLEYNIENNSVVISKKEPNFLDRVMARFQAIDVRGRVIDSLGNALPGASIRVKNGKGSATTNVNGEFYLQDVDEDVVIVISFIGYKPVEIRAKKELGLIKLEISSGDLEEVVINKGYYTTTKELNTGNVSYIGAKELGNNPVGDPLIALQGRASGLFLSQSSGVTGSYSNIRLRGQNSLRITPGANDPLFIIDGIPFDAKIPSGSIYSGTISTISPFTSIQLNDIESIEVLKDADATAIYGSRGANGVILVTTKKGQVGKTALNVNVYHGAGDVPNRLDLMNTKEYLSMRRKALANDGRTAPSATDYDLNGKWGDINRYTDWQDVFLGGTAYMTNAQVSVSGGNEYTQLLFGGQYRKETTVYPGDYFDNKYSGHLNVNHKSSNSRFKSNLSISYVRDINQVPNEDFTRKIVYAPNSPELYNADGTLNWQNNTFVNPFRTLYQSTTIRTNNLNTGLSLGYELIKDLNVAVRGGYNNFLIKSNQITPLRNLNPSLPQNPTQRLNQFSTLERNNLIIEPTINYKKSFNFGTFDAVVGATWQSQRLNSLAQYASGYSSDAMITNIAAAAYISVENMFDTEYKYSAVYARIGYNYADQYLLNLTGRRDASSRFGPGKQFGNFGAVGAAWIFTKQDVIARNLQFLSFGKLRGSYGITGNDQIGDYGFLDTYTANGETYQGISVINPSGIANTQYGWETVKKLEFGLELGFLKDRILLGTSWFRNRTSNQLVGLALPDIAGLPSVQANLPALLQNDGFEFDLTTKIFSNKNFSWTTTANVTVPRSELLAFQNFEQSSYTSRYRVGEPLSIQLAYHYTGLDPAKNVYTFEDFNKDNAYNLQDRLPYFVGQHSYGGINNSFSYKGLQLDVFFQYTDQVGKRSTSSGIAPGLFQSGTTSNVIKSTSPDFATGSQQYTQSSSTDAGRAFSRYVTSNAIYGDASFIRLKNVALSWNFPARYLKVVKLQSARVYLQGQNLLTITGFKGLDPETSVSSALVLPPLRMLIAGVQFSL